MTRDAISILAAEITTADWIVASSVMVVSLVAVAAVRLVVRALVKPFRLQEYATKLITRTLSTAILVLALIYALGQLGVAVGPLVGALGIGGIVIALALQPVMGNLVAAIMLHARRPIRPGDQIHSGGHRGTVLEINSRALVLITFDGEFVHIPNLSILDSPLLNQTAEEYRRTVLPFQIGYDADLRQAQQVLVRAIRELDALGDAPSPADVLVTGFADSGVDMVARFWHPSEELSAWHAVSEVAITIRETLRLEDITIPFPQRVLHMADTDAAATSPLDPAGEIGRRDPE